MGCNEVFLYISIFIHETVCSFRIINCKLCSTEIIEKDIVKHNLQCTEVKIQCCKCKFQEKRKSFSHSCNALKLRNIFENLSNNYKIDTIKFLNMRLKGLAKEFLNIGNDLFNIKKYKEAFKCYEEALKLDSSSSEIYKSKGNSYYIFKKI